MASTKRERDGDGQVPLRDDEEDIVEEVRAEEDENGELVTTEANIRRVGGARDAESVRENRQRREIVKRKRAGEKVPFNSDDILLVYDDLLKTMPPGAIEIRQKKLTGSQVTYTIRSQPRSGVELYDVFMQNHAQSGVEEYKITFVAAKGKTILNSGRITLPDTRPPHLRDPAMPYQQPPYAPPGYSPQGYAPQQGAPPPQAPPPAAAPSTQDRFAEFNAMRDFMMGLGWAPPGQAAPAPQQPQMPPGMDMAQMREMAAFFKSIGWEPPRQQAPAPAPQPQYAPQQPQQPSAMQPPPYAPYPGTEWVYKPEQGWIQQQIQRQRPRFEQHDDGGHEVPRQPYRVPPPPREPPRRERTPLEEFRAMASQYKQFEGEIRNVFGSGRSEPYEPPDPEESEGPLKTQKFGDLDTIVDDTTGGIAWGPTLAVNLPKGIKWLGDQLDKVKQEQLRQQEPQQQSQPPPQQPQQPYPLGWKFVVEEQPQQQGWPQQQGLQPPPTQVPPTIQETQPPPPGQRAWGAPPEEGG